MKKPPFVEIEWEDSIGAGGWHTAAELTTFVKATATDHSTCYSAGYLLAKDRVHVVVAHSLHNENICAPLSIPRRMVRSIRYIR